MGYHIETLWRIYTPANLDIINPYNGLSPARSQAITETKADLLSTKPAGTTFLEFCIKMQKICIIKRITNDKYV